MKLLFFIAANLSCCFVNAQVTKAAIPKLESKFIRMEQVVADSLNEFVIRPSNRNFSNKDVKVKDLKLPAGTKFYLKNDSAVIVSDSSGILRSVQKFIPCCWTFKDYYRIPVLIKTMTCLRVDNDHILYKMSNKSSTGTYQVLNKGEGYRPAQCFEVVIRVPAYVSCKSCISIHCTATVNIGGVFYAFPIAQPQQRPDNQGQLSMPCGNCPEDACQTPSVIN